MGCLREKFCIVKICIVLSLTMIVSFSHILEFSRQFLCYGDFILLLNLI